MSSTGWTGLIAPALSRRAWAARGRIRPSVVAAAFVLALIVFIALWPDAIAAHPNDTAPAQALRPPSVRHPFGTDQLGRDMLARIVHGARTSLLLGVGATVLGATAGALWGIAAGLGHRMVGEVLTRATEVLLALPAIMLAMIVVATLGASTTNAIIAIAVAVSPAFALTIRAQILVIRSSGYVTSARILGVPRHRIVVHHVLPNTLRPVAVLATLTVGSAILAGAGLSFLGLGTAPPAPEWGSMLAGSRDYLQRDWRLAAFPGAAITVTVLSFSVLGRAVQARLDHRSRR